MGKIRVVRLKMDQADYEAIQEAIAIRRSGLFRTPDGTLVLADGEGDMKSKLLGEICRQWVEELSMPLIQGIIEKKALIASVAAPLKPTEPSEVDRIEAFGEDPLELKPLPPKRPKAALTVE